MTDKEIQDKILNKVIEDYENSTEECLHRKDVKKAISLAFKEKEKGFLERIEKYNRKIKDFIWDCFKKGNIDLREKILMFIEKEEKELKSSLGENA